MVTEKDGPIVVAMPDHPPDGLVHSPGCLLPVPVMAGEELRWAEAPSRQLEHYQPTPSPAPHMAPSPTQPRISPGPQPRSGPSSHPGTAS